MPRGPVTIDFETTDKDAHKAEPVEVAIFGLDSMFQELIKPEKPIPFETSAIHHISNDDVKYCRSWAEVKAGLRGVVDTLDTKILVAHNAEYEKAILKDGFEDCQWICTYKCALRLWPDLPNHKNETIRYALGLSNLGRASNQNTHSAQHDAVVTFEILQRMLQEVSIDQLISWSSQPKAFPKIPFGKHAGTKWSMIPQDYLLWITRQVDMDPDIIYCAKTELQERQPNATKRPR